MLNVKIIAVGKMKEKFYIDAFNEYAKRLSRFCKFDCIELSECSLDKEADAVIEYLNKNNGSFVISLCVEGIRISSTDLAEIIRDIPVKGYSKIVFIIGGSNGLDDRVKSLSNLRLSMSDMTFPHHLARVIIAEQIYRAFMINEGSTYHK